MQCMSNMSSVTPSGAVKMVQGEAGYRTVDEELCLHGATEVLCDGLQIALMIGNLCADI